MILGAATWNEAATLIHANNVKKGFWPDNVLDRNFGEALALVHAEYTEAYYETDNTYLDKKVPYRALYVELADAAIRILDLGGAHGVFFDSSLDENSYWTPKDITQNLLTLHALVSEILEYHRDNNEKYKPALQQLFWTTLLVMRTAGCENPVEVIAAKVSYNVSRPHKHGKVY
jgi:hypothetical protein